jgi:hypothetical protein
MRSIEDNDEKNTPLLQADHVIAINNGSRFIEFKDRDLKRVCANNFEIRNFLLENFTSQGILEIESEYKAAKANIEEIKKSCLRRNIGYIFGFTVSCALGGLLYGGCTMTINYAQQSTQDQGLVVTPGNLTSLIVSGLYIVCSIGCIWRAVENFETPGRYLPERFLEELVERIKNRNKIVTDFWKTIPRSHKPCVKIILEYVPTLK